MKSLALGVATCSMLVSCGAESKYTKGDPLPKGTTNVGQSAEENDLKAIGFNLSSKAVSTLDSGVPQCLVDGGHTKVSIKDYGITLENFLTTDFEALGASNYDQWYLLWDLILQKNTDPTTGFVNYAAISGQYSAQWQKLKELISKTDIPNSAKSIAAEPGITDAKKNAYKALEQSFWINMYNIVMFDAILAEPDTDKATSLAGGKVFSDAFKMNIGGKDLYLDGIEYGILGLGAKPSHADEVEKLGITPIVETEQYEQAHVALVCGAKSCPKLRNFAYRPDNVFAVFEENLKIFANDQETHMKPSGSSFKVSSLMNWFFEDFRDGIAGNNWEGFATKYVSSTCRTDSAELITYLSKVKTRLNLSFSEYDWSINRQ